MRSQQAQTTQQWNPILPETEKKQILCIIEHIANDLETSIPLNTSLGRGSAGHALFFSYLHQAIPNQGYDRTSQQIINSALAQPVLSTSYLSLLGGLSGLTWVVDHLSGLTLDLFEEDPNEELDALLLDHLNEGPLRSDFDLVAGITGWGKYWVDRPSQFRKDSNISRIIDHLDHLVQRYPEGYAWYTGRHLLTPWQLDQSPNGYFDLGMAHGQAGIIAFLASVWSKGFQEPRIYNLASNAIRWLLAQRVEHQESDFPRVTQAGKPFSPSRVAWCYGDLGIAMALLKAGRAFTEPEWINIAVEIAQKAAKRPLEHSGVKDASLCHGSAGNAHLFYRIYQSSGKDCFKAAARKYIDQTLDFYHPEAGIGGFQAWQPSPDSANPWKNQGGFLEGSVGIGLALLAAISDIEPKWDSVLMVS